MTDCKHDGRIFYDGPSFPEAREGDAYVGQTGVYTPRCAKVVERPKDRPYITCDEMAGEPVAGRAYKIEMRGYGRYSEKHGDFVFKEGDGGPNGR